MRALHNAAEKEQLGARGGGSELLADLTAQRPLDAAKLRLDGSWVGRADVKNHMGMTPLHLAVRMSFPGWSPWR